MREIFLGALFSYFLGSIPTAYLFGKLYKGIDIRLHGSGHVGATNTFRVLGKVPGTIVLILDILKGLLAVTVIGDLFHVEGVMGRVILGLAAVSGHNWTVFLNFKGGKGIATTLGVLLGLTMKISSFGPALGICVLSWVIIFLITGFVSAASLVAAVMLPVVLWVMKQPLEIISLGAVFCVFVVVRHRSNIQRLLSGKESKVNFPFKRNKT
jgi:acyl phosphate:glycerol-3-phosphate acyltransferase